MAMLAVHMLLKFTPTRAVPVVHILLKLCPQLRSASGAHVDYYILPLLLRCYNSLRWASAMGAHVYRFIMPRIGLVPWVHMFIVL